MAQRTLYENIVEELSKMPNVSFARTSNGPAGLFSDLRNWGQVYLRSDRKWFKTLVTEEDVKNYLANNPDIPPAQRITLVPRLLDFSLAYRKPVGTVTYEADGKKLEKILYDQAYIVVI